MKKKIMIYLLVSSVPLLVFVNVWQSFRFNRVLNTMEDIREETSEWVESNNRLEAGIAAYDSPGRLDALASQELDLEKKLESPDVLIYFPESEEGLNE